MIRKANVVARRLNNIAVIGWRRRLQVERGRDPLAYEGIAVQDLDMTTLHLGYGQLSLQWWRDSETHR